MKKTNKIEMPNVTLMALLIGVFVFNQFMIMSVSASMGMGSMLSMNSMFGVSTANAMEIMMPIPTEDGKITHLQMMPTITEVLADPNSGDLVADGMAVMIATGMPFYSPDNLSFDQAVEALDGWNKYEKLEGLSPELEARYKKLIGAFPCNFCCGSPTDVTINGRCGCKHARAARGFFKYMLNEYGDTYSDEELYGEAYKWQAIWYPSGVVQDYLLATGRGDAIGHDTHGGAGTDGNHGI